MDIFGVYKQLLKSYGPQGWWPIFISTDLAYGIKYNDLKKHKTKFRDPYFETAIGAILAQSTAWRNVAKAITNLYSAKALRPELILKLTDSELERLIRPAGYFKQKARKIKIFCRWLMDNYEGDLKKLKKFRVSKIREELLRLWGIGKETADSIILYSLNKPIFVIDEYSRRLCRQNDIIFKEYDEYQNLFQNGIKLKNLTPVYREFHALIVEWGKHNKKTTL